jgi:P4 family phage/plasmid primase-like protien
VRDHPVEVAEDWKGTQGSPAAAHADQVFRLTFGTADDQTTPWTDVRTLAWSDLCALLTRHQIGPKKGSCIVPARLRGKRRKKAYADCIEIAMLDSDAGTTLEEIAAAIRALGWAAIVSSTHSHLSVHTTATRLNWDRFKLAHGDKPDLAQAFLQAERSYLPGIAVGARLIAETKTEVVLEHQPCPKFRVTIPLLHPWIAGTYPDQDSANAAWAQAIAALAHALGLQHDQSCTDTSRLFYLPRRPADGPQPETMVLDGAPCDIFGLPPASTPVDAGPRRKRVTRSAHQATPPVGGAAAYGRGLDLGHIEVSDPETGEVFNLTSWAANSAPHFQIVDAVKARHPEILRGKIADGTKHHIRCPNEEAHTQAGADHATFIVNASESTTSGFVIHCRHDHCTDRDRLLFLKQMIEQRWLTIGDLQNPAFLHGSDDGDGPWPDDELTEHKVADHFASRCVSHLRYCHTRGAWFVWTGSHWRQNNTRLAFHWVRSMTAKLNDKATPRIKAATSRASFASAVERFALADPRLAVTETDWNTDPWLLATPGGTVDLRSGQLTPAAQGYLISRATAVTPSGSASCPSWLAFLDQATGSDVEVIAFLQRWLGYCLTGITREHSLLFVYGPGGNGKGVLLGTVNGILQDYAVTAALDTFTAAQGERHSTEIAMLAGPRFVMTTETEEGRAWAEARIKALTGGDPVTARFMRQDNFTFTPAFKLTISGNHKPALRNVDDAARRRFLVLPFLHKPASPNPHLVDELRAEWPGILQWMVEGCLTWQRQGLKAPSAVLAATAEYFAEQDLFAQWLDDCCDRGPNCGAATADLYRSWSAFLVENGEPARSKKAFSTLLERQNFQKAKDCGHFRGRGYLGLRLRPAEVKAHWSETDA